MPQFDLDAIRRLTALEVGKKLDLVHQRVKNFREDRWAWRESTTDAYISFSDDGEYHDHQQRIGGDAIRLVMQAKTPGRGDPGKGGALFREACHEIAQNFGLWRSYDDERGRSKTLSSADQKAVDRSAEQFLRLDISPAKREAAAALDALKLDADRITIAVAPQAGVAWMPAVPWQGVRKFQKEGGVNGGWTKASAARYYTDADALRVVFADLDGAGKGADIGMVYRLIAELKTQGLPCAVLVASSWVSKDRIKAHLYFRAERQARDADEWMRWSGHLQDRIASTVARWDDVAPEERDELAADPASTSPTRLLRLPGHSKPGRDAAVVLDTWPGRVVDFGRVVEQVDEEFSWQIADGHSKTFEFGSVLRVTEIKPGDDGPKTTRTIMARDVWPIANYRQVESGDHGVLLAFRSRSGQHEHHAFSAAGFTDNNGAKREASKASKLGVKIRVGCGAGFASMIATWAEQHQDKVMHLADTPGWHAGTAPKDTYVNGIAVATESGQTWQANDQSEAIAQRSQRGGSLEGWAEGVKSLATTPILQMGLGVSFAAPLVGLLSRDGFLVHLHGDSSSGKSAAAKMSASVWGKPSRYMASWDTTLAGAEGLAERCDGALLALDEFQRLKGTPDDAGQMIHLLASGQGRTRANRDGSPKPVRTWGLTVVSTGEVSLRDRCGDGWQGGHNVRAIDVPIRVGDSTADARHADAVASFSEAHYGHASDAWVRYVLREKTNIRASVESWRDELVKDDEGAETNRILERLALPAAALEHARIAGLTPWSDDEIRETIDWIVDRSILGAHRSLTPCERADAMLQTLIDTEPSRFPTHAEPGNARQVIAYKVQDMNGLPALMTTHRMLKAAGIADRVGCDLTRWIEWMQEQGWLVAHDKHRRGEFGQQRWMYLRRDELTSADSGAA